MKTLLGLLGTALSFFLLIDPASAQEVKAKTAAKNILAKYQDALITVKLIVKNKGGGLENQLEIAGTVLSSDGLTVVSDFSSNPSALFISENDQTETTDVKLIFKDGREVPATFVLRDKELDLAFVMPQEKTRDLPHVKMEKGPVPGPLDDLVFIYRLGKSLNREVAVTLGRVDAVIKKPRTFVVSDFLNGVQSLGCPVFDDSGRPVGVVVLRRAQGPTKIPAGVTGILDLFKPVVLTAEDIQDAANQISKPKDKSK